MIVVGLTGSIAMGKSEVVNVIRGENIQVFDADEEVHALYDSQEGARLLKDLVPEATMEGRVNRQRLSEIVLAEPARLDQLEKLVHAEIAKRRKAFIARAKRMGQTLVVADVPLLFEKSGDKDVDFTVVVSAPAAQQRQRALARPGMTKAKLDMILTRQMPDAEKQKRADHVIHNTGTLADLAENTRAVLAAIREEHNR